MQPRSGFLAVLVAAGLSPAQAAEWIVEADPLVYALGGASLHVRVHPQGHWTFGAGGAAGLEIPSSLLQAGPEGTTSGWTVHVPYALAVSADRSFRSDGDGWSIGGQTGVQHLRSRHDGGPVSSKGAGFAVARMGWRWRPFDGGLHVFPWMGIGVTDIVYGERVGPDLPRIVPFGAVHVGWRF